jgi:hypothetical protein
MFARKGDRFCGLFSWMARKLMVDWLKLSPFFICSF